LVAGLALALVASADAQPVRLTALERAQGWRLLFDGVSLSDWHAYGAGRTQANWQTVDGSLIGTPGVPLATVEDFEDFELTFDWKVEAGGRGEVYYRVAEDGPKPGDTGPVMELAGHAGPLGGDGGLTPVSREVPPQSDVWYRARLVVYGQQVEHWINGELICSYRLESSAWRTALAASGRQVAGDYGRLSAGRIVLAGDGVYFRNIKLKAL
jgi:hypothetical protein